MVVKGGWSYFWIQQALDDSQSLHYLWVLFLGLAGSLDIAASVIPPLVNTEGNGLPYNLQDTGEMPILQVVASFLDRNDVTISFFFSALWFLDAFYSAHVRRQETLQEQERKSLQVQNGDSKAKWWQNPSFVYHRTVAIQCLLLPVGFYFVAYCQLQGLFQGEKVEAFQVVPATQETLSANDTDKALLPGEVFSATSKISVFFALIHHVYGTLRGTVFGNMRGTIKAQLNTFLRSKGPKAIRQVVGNAIRNPFQFRRTIRKLLTVVRWVKYLLPLLGAANKLKLHLVQMRKRRRQRRVALQQKRIRQLLWERKPVVVRKEDAARMIQSAFRAYRTRKLTNALLALKGDERYFAALRIQRATRRALARARSNLEAKRLQLAKLRQLQREQLSQTEKRRFYELQDELGNEARDLLNRKLLLRPNTRFSVAWKFLFVVCVSIEIAQLAVKPLLHRYEARKASPMTMSEFVAKTFVPTPISKSAQCGHPEKKSILVRTIQRLPLGNSKDDTVDMDDLPWFCYPPVSTLQEAYRDVMALALIPSPTSQWPDCQDVKRTWPWQAVDDRKPWYCEDPYTSYHTKYREIVDHWLEEYLVLVGVVCFLDVFVTCFTGDFHPVSGELVPRPFFARWIMPGLLMQLLVNPQLANVAAMVRTGWQMMAPLGPIRVLRWSVASVFPVLYFVWIHFIRLVWFPLVHYQNEFETMVSGLL